MFKPTSKCATLIGRKNLVGDKDRKVLKNHFVSQFPTKGIDTFNALFPPEESLSILSVKGSNIEVYFSEDVPLIFTHSKRKPVQLFPTLVTLWRMPDLLPAIMCQEQAPRYLLRGADLMLPGCIPPPDGYISTPMDKNQVWAVRVMGNPLPFAVGNIIMNREELAHAEKGKLLEVQHILGDLLFKYANLTDLPEGFTLTNCEAIIEEKRVPEAAAQAQDAVGSSVETAEPNSSSAENNDKRCEVQGEASRSNADKKAAQSAMSSESESEADDETVGRDTSAASVPSAAAAEGIIEYVLYDVLIKQITDAMIPVYVSAIWGRVSQLIGPAVADCNEELESYLRQRGCWPINDEEGKPCSLNQCSTTDLKKTSWKNIKRFANHFKKTKVWTLKEVRGQQTVVKINRSHPVIIGHKCLPDNVIAASEVANMASSTRNNKVTKADKQGKPDASTPAATQPSSNPSQLLAGHLMPVTAYQSTALSRELLFGTSFTASKGTDYSALWTEAEVFEALREIFEKLRKSDSHNESFPRLDSSKACMPSVEDAHKVNLSWYDLIPCDQTLMNICLTKAERQLVKTSNEPAPALSEKEILKRFLANGMKLVTLLLPQDKNLEEALASPQEHKIIEAAAKVSVAIQRTKRFTRTKVAGIHLFPMIDPKQLAERLQKACAASASVCELDEVKGKNKPMCVIVQGSVVKEVCAILENDYGLPKSMIVAGTF